MKKFFNPITIFIVQMFFATSFIGIHPVYADDPVQSYTKVNSYGISKTFTTTTWTGTTQQFKNCVDNAYKVDESGAKAAACTMCKINNDAHNKKGARGAMWLKSSADGSIIELTSNNASGISIKLYGGVYECGGSGTTNMDAKHILFVTQITNGTTYENYTRQEIINAGLLDNYFNQPNKDTPLSRGSRHSGHNWSDAAGPMDITLKTTAFFDGLGKPKNGIYTKTTHIWRCPKGNTSAGNCWSDAKSFIQAAKIATFSHTNSATYNGDTYSNGGIITIPKDATNVDIDFSHILQRSDGWTTTSIGTNYAMENTTYRERLKRSTGNFTNTYTINNTQNSGFIAPSSEVSVCSYVTYRNIVGLDGYKRPDADGDTTVSRICVRVQRAGEGELNINGNSKVTDSSNPANSGQDIVINLPYDVESRRVTFSHALSRGDSYNLETEISHSISESLNGIISEWKVGSGWPTGTTPVALRQGALTKTHSFDKTIRLNQGETEKICQTLHWTPTKASFETSSGNNVLESSVIYDSTPNSTEACVTASRARLTGRSPKEKSNVTIGSIHDNNGEDTRVGTATVTGNTKTDYRANFTHFLKLDEPFDEANVSYTIQIKYDNGNWQNYISGSKTLNSEDWITALADAQNLSVENWGETNQICERVVYSPTIFAFINESYDPSVSTGELQTTHEVCASVVTPSAETETISAESKIYDYCKEPAGEATSGTCNLPTSSNTGTFHFTHRLTNNNEQNLGISLPTTYDVYFKEIIHNRNPETGAITETVQDYQPRDDYYQIPVEVSPTERTIIIDRPTRTINPNQSITICEYISINNSRFQIAGSPSMIVGRDTSLRTEEVCQTIARPGLMTKYGPDIEINGNTSYSLSGTTSKIFLDGTTGNTTKYKLGNVNDIQVNFNHSLIRNNVENSEIINSVYYLFEENTVSHSVLSFDDSQTTRIDNNSSVSLPKNNNDEKSLDVKNMNAIPTNALKPGETKSACRNVYFRHNRYKISYQYYYDWEGNRLDVAGTPYVTQTPDTTTDGIGNSNPVCVEITRPYNFRIDFDGLNRTGLTASSEIVYPGSIINTINYDITVQKRDNTDYWNNFALTGIPNAKIQLLGLIVNDNIVNSDLNRPSLTGETNPCSHYRSMLGSDNLADCYPIETFDRSDNYTINDGNYSAGANAEYYLSDNSFIHHYSNKNSITVPTSLGVGQKFCTALAVSPIDSGNGTIDDFNYSQWVVSNVSCATVGKKPTVQVLGGSVFSNGSVDTSKSTKRTIDEETGEIIKETTFGSWTDFAIIVRNPGQVLGKANQGMASGAGLAGGKENASLICSHSPLTIANIQCASSTSIDGLGEANVVRERGAAEFYDSLVARYINTEDSSLHYTDGATYEIPLDSTTLIIYSANSITINNNITLADKGFATSGYSNLSSIPQIIILSGGNVTIGENVTQIDAWIVAKEAVNTCDGKPTTNLDYDTCNKQLRINGPVIANNIQLVRTYGGNAVDGDTFTDGRLDGGLSEAAEIINYTPTTLLWEYYHSTQKTEPKTTYLKKLAPRW